MCSMPACLKFVRKYAVSVVVAVLSVWLLFGCFTNNRLGAAPDDLFRNWQNDSEALVLGRLMESQQSGMFSDYGLLKRDLEWEASNKYVLNQRADQWYTYNAGMGLQGIGFGIFDKLTTLTNARTLDYMYAINCILLASLITFIAMWAYFHYNVTSAISVILFSAFNVWLTISARNLYWVVWTLLLPFCVVLAFLWLEEKTSKKYLWSMQLCIFLSVLMRVGAGFEFTTSVLIAMEVPFIYYALKDKWTMKQYVLRSLWAGISGLAAFVTALFINLYQQAMLYGDLGAGIEHLIYNIDKRTGFFGNPVAAVHMNALQTPVWKVISTYISNGTSLVFSDLRMDKLLIWLLFFTALILIAEQYSPRIHQNRAKLIALGVITWVSLLCPISWFVLAKGHSAIHITINYLLWSIPCLFLVFAFGGAVAEYLTKDILARIKKRGIMFACILTICAFVFLPFGRFYKVPDWKGNLKTIDNAITNGTMLYREQNRKIILENGILYYVENKGNDTDKTFFLHIEPQNINDLPEKRIEHKFDNYDFHFATKKMNLPFWSEYSVAQVSLPTYAIQSITTGQFDTTGQLWGLKAEM